MKKKVYVFLLCCFFCCRVQSVEFKGKASIAYQGKTPPTEVKAKARDLAALSAAARFVNRGADSRAKNILFNARRDQLLTEIDQLVFSTHVITESVNSSDKTYTVLLSATLNTNYLNTILTPDISSGNTETMAFIFVAREQSKIKVTSLSSDNRTAEKVTYKVSPAQNLNVAAHAVFSQSGYEAVDIGYLEASTNGLIQEKDFIKDYRSGGINNKTLNAAVIALKKEKFSYMATGTLDTMLEVYDAPSGLYRVSVMATMQVRDITGRHPKVVASVGPELFSANASGKAEARNYALKKAVATASEKLVAQLHAKAMKRGLR